MWGNFPPVIPLAAPYGVHHLMRMMRRGARPMREFGAERSIRDIFGGFTTFVLQSVVSGVKYIFAGSYPYLLAAWVFIALWSFKERMVMEEPEGRDISDGQQENDSKIAKDTAGAAAAEEAGKPAYIRDLEEEILTLTPSEAPTVLLFTEALKTVYTASSCS